MSEPVTEHAASSFTKKIGPLPGFAWVLIVAGGAWGFYMWKQRSTPQTVGVAAYPSAATTAMDTSAAIPGATGPTYNGTVVAGPGGLSMPTNGAWAKTITDALVATGTYSPSDVSNALSKYLNGGAVNSQEQSIINMAIRQYGSPPDGVLPVQTTPEIPGHNYTVQAGDTMDSINQRFYGRTSAIDERLIADANPGIISWLGSTWGNVAPGTVIKLPTTGIAGIQQNTLNTYDHTIPTAVDVKQIPGGATVSA